MKKLLTAAVASTFAFLAMGVVNGDEIDQGANFEASGFVSGEAFNYSLTDEAGADGYKFWYTEDTEADNIISNYPSTGTGVPIASRPDKFASNSNSKYLRVETTGKLWRSVKNNGGSSDFLTNTTASLDVYGYSITNSAIYLDTLVKFTPADGEFAADALSDGDKIAISYVEHEADTDGDVSYTNFVIRAGLIVGQQLFQTNYFAYLPDDPTFANFDKDAWHRLTVRTIPEVGTSENPGGVGFVIYIDETNLTYSADVDAGFGTLNATAQGFYDNAKHALFPSAREAGAIGGKTISAASFSGNGSLDDVVFTTTTPTFIASSETPMVTVTWDTDVVSAITIAGNAVTGEDFAAGSKVVELEGAALAVTATAVGAYELVYSPTYENGEFTGLAAGDTCSITGFIPLFDVGGTHYPTFAAAVAAAQSAGTEQNPATIMLLADCNEALSFESGYIVLDLAGHDLQATSDEAAFTIANMGANLVITNSGAEASVQVPTGSASSGLIYLSELAGFTTIQAGTFDGYIYCYISETSKEPVDMLSITGGKFLDQTYDESEPQPFYLASCVAVGLEISYLGSNYFQVGAAAPQPTTFALTTTGGANATVTTTPADVSALTEATEVTITATAEQDYTYDGVDLSGTDWTYDSAADAISMTLNVTADTEIAVPNAVSESSDDWPEGQDLVDAEGKAAGDLFPGITNALATADAKAVATWAEAKGVAYADKGGILPEAFLLDCANTQAAIDEAAANFKVTAITVAGDTVTITPADGADYGNGKVVIEGTATLSPISWHEKTDGDHFFRATLVVKPVTP